MTMTTVAIPEAAPSSLDLSNVPYCNSPYCLPCTGEHENIRRFERYTTGDCYLLAHALHKLTGWPMKMLIDSPHGNGIHAFVQMPSGDYLDVEGICPKGPAAFYEYLSDDEAPVVIKPLTVEELADWASPYHEPGCPRSVAESEYNSAQVARKLLQNIGHPAPDC
jgi:hypothetical protein